MSDNKIQFSIDSVMDDFGRVFFMNNKVYRAITHNSVNKCREMLNEPFFVELMKLGLVPQTSITNMELPEYGLVLEHEKLLNTQQYEWTFSMFKNAALTIIKILNICQKYDYELKDAHTKNILFRGNQAVYVDIGSFQKKTQEEWSAQYEFISCFYVPLSLWAEGELYIARKIIESNLYFMRTIPNQTILDSGITRLVKKKPFNYTFILFKKYRLSKNNQHSKLLEKVTSICNKIISRLRGQYTEVLSYHTTYKTLDEMEKDISNIFLPNLDTLWKNYHTKLYTDGNIKLPSSERFDRIIELIQNIKSKDNINSVLELAGNSGLLSFLIEERLKIPMITLSDYDETALEQAYEIQASRNTAINFVLLNFMLPINNEDTAKRLKSDIVLALAVTHHLILTGNFLLSSIFERISLYSNKYVITEFMPMGLYSTESDYIPDIPEWYTVDWFKDEFEKHFTLEYTIQLEKNRILFVGKIKLSSSIF